MRLSVLIIAKNEAHNIEDCISSVAFADEIIVIDDMSEDATPELAQKMGAKVFSRAMNGDFGGQQQFSIEQSSGDWLFFIDCDERVTPALAKEMQEVVHRPVQAAYLVRRLNHFGQKRIRFGTLRPDWVCRLMPAKSVQFTELVHQKVIHPYPEKKLKHDMLHYTYPTWNPYFRKFDQYTKLSAEKYLEAGKSVSFVRDIMLRPLWAFFKMYVIHLGFLDGKMGWILAVNHYHYTMTKYVRFYYLKKPL